MAKLQTAVFKDDYGVNIHTYSWVPKSARAAVQISHGLGDHARRFTEFAEYLAGHGYAVYADDHRGHGETGREQYRGDLTQLGKLGPGGLRGAEDALLNFSQIIRSVDPSLPLVYLGQSWGSLMGQRILNRGDRSFDAVIFTGSAYRMPGYMESGSLNKRHKHLGDTGYEWLSTDPDVAAKFKADELAFDADVLKLFGVIDGLKLFGVPNDRVPDIPMLLASGTDDSLALKYSVEKLAASYKNRGVTDVTLKMYAGYRHEILNEIGKEEVFEDIKNWLDNKIKLDDEVKPDNEVKPGAAQ